MIIFISLFFLFLSCSPIKSLPEGEGHQMELNLHEVRINVDDLIRDITCFKTQMEILDKKIDYQEKSLKKEIAKNVKEKFSALSKNMQLLEEKFLKLDEMNKEFAIKKDEISKYLEEVSVIFSQYQKKLNSLEDAILKNDQKLSKLQEIKNTIDKFVLAMNYQIYKVEPKDTLDDISKRFNVKLSELRRINGIKGDLIIVGQEIKIPK